MELLKQEDIIPIFFKRYVDDCLMAIRRQDISRIVEVFNSYHPRLQFTVEIEENGRLKFLDTIMRRTEEGITLEWTPKDVNGRYLDYLSVSPFTHKKNTIIALVDRAIKLSDANVRPNSLDSMQESILRTYRNR